MNEIQIFRREISSTEFKRMKSGFDENATEHNVDIQSSERMGFVAMDQSQFAGCSSGLAYKNGEKYSGWFYLTDLYVEKKYRSQGLGSKLLTSLENYIIQLEIRQIWTWTAGYEAPEFYQRKGYEIFTEMTDWYSGGISRIGLKKSL